MTHIIEHDASDVSFVVETNVSSDKLVYIKHGNDMEINIPDEDTTYVLVGYYELPVGSRVDKIVTTDYPEGSIEELAVISEYDIDLDFDDLFFSRNGNKLLIINKNDESVVETLYEFFTSASPVDRIVANGEPKSILNDAVINVIGVKNYTGFNIQKDGVWTGYDEKITTINSGAIVYGNYGDDEIHGGMGSDWLQGSEGTDTVYGGETGEDMIAGDSGNDYLYAGKLNSNSSITYNTDDVEIYGGSGDDYIYSGAGNDFIVGGSGTDIITLNGGSNTIDFVNIGEGENELAFGVDTIIGATVADTLRFSVNYGSAKAPNYFGYKITDLTFTKNENDLEISAGEGNKAIVKDYFAEGTSKLKKVKALNVDGIEQTFLIETDFEGSAEGENIVVIYDGEKHQTKGGEGVFVDAVIYGNGGDDTIHGSNKQDWINGSEGGDVIFGGSAGEDMLAGEAGDDFIYAGKLNSDSTVTYNPDDVEIYGGSGNDQIHSGAGDDFIVGGSGTDIITLNGGSNVIDFVNIGEGENELDFGTDTIIGATAADTLRFSVNYGSAEAPNYLGYKITDLAFTKNENDLEITAGEDNKVIVKDYFISASKLKTVKALDINGIEQTYIISSDFEGSVQGENIAVIYDGEKHETKGGEGVFVDAVVYGNGGNDTIHGAYKQDWINGSEGNDTIYGGTAGEDMLSGDVGDDYIYAGKLNSDGTVTYNTDDVEIYGGSGDDHIYSGSGDDFIWGGSGTDTITLNGGANTMVFVEENFGADTVYNSTDADTLRFSVNYGTAAEPNYSGYEFKDLSFTRSGYDLVVATAGSDTNRVYIKDFYKPGSSMVDNVVALERDEETGVVTQKTFSIKENIPFNIVLNGEDFVKSETEYAGYIINVSGTGTVTGLTEGDSVTFDGETTMVCNGNKMSFTYGENKTLTINDFLGDGGNIESPAVYFEGTSKIVFENKDVTMLGRTFFSNYDALSEKNIFKSVNITGTINDDIFIGGTGNDTINAGTGDDVIYGMGGNDLFIFNIGDGEDDLSDIDSNAKIQINDTFDHITFERSPIVDEYLLIKYGESDVITVRGYFNEDGSVSSNHVNKFKVNGVDYVLEWKQSGGFEGHEGMYLVQENGTNIVAVENIQNWINSGLGNDNISGKNNYDMLAGNSGVDNISTENPYTEIYGGSGNDIISATGGNSFIVGGENDDNITVAGGNNTIAFVNTPPSEGAVGAFGIDNVSGTTSTDILKFSLSDGSGYKFEDLTFVKNVTSGDLEISAGVGNVAKISGFFGAESKVDKLMVSDGEGGQDLTKTIKNNALIHVETSGNYTAESNYSEAIKSSSNLAITFTNNSAGKDYLDFGGVSLDELEFVRNNNDLDIKNGNITTKVVGYYVDGNNFGGVGLITAEGNATELKDITVYDVINVADYHATDAGQNIALVQGAVDENDGRLQGNTYESINPEVGEVTVNSYAKGGSGADTVYGTGGNDWISGSEGADKLYGGTSGNDMLIGGDGADIIYAGKLNDDGSVTYNSDSVEIYGDKGADQIYSGSGDDFIHGGSGDDIIILNGGTNTILISGELDGFVDTVKGATANDTIKFSEHKFSELGFRQSGESLLVEIRDNETVKGTVKIEGFFSEGASKLDKIIALDEEGNEEPYSIFTDAKYVEMAPVSDYHGNDYKEYVPLVKGEVNEEDDVLHGNIYKSNADNQEYTVDAYAAPDKGDDVVVGTDGNDWINGGEGNDIIYGGVGGHDMLSGHMGSNTIVAGVLNPDGTYTYNETGVEIYGAEGNDTIIGGKGNDFIWAKGGNDTITANGGATTYVFVEDDFGEDTLYNTSDDDTLKFAVNYGDRDNPVYVGYTYDEVTFVRDDETDIVTITAQHEGGKANKVIIPNYSTNSANTIIVLNNERTGYMYKDIQDIIPTPHYDEYTIRKSTITGTALSDLIDGGETKLAGKSKTIKGVDGNDLLIGGIGNDKLYGGSGKNVFSFSEGDGKDTVYSEGGIDRIEFHGFTEDSKFIMSESGKDLIISYGNSGDKVTVKNFFKGNHSVKGYKVFDQYGDEIVALAKDLSASVEDPSVIVLDMETLNKTSIKGSAFSETIIGSQKNNTIKGGGGNDVIYATTGTNKIYTQSVAGDEATVYAGTGKDTFNAGKGVDTYIFSDGTLNDTISANSTGTVIIDVSNLSDVSYSEKGNNLIITNKYEISEGIYTTETLTVKNYLKNKLTDSVMIFADGMAAPLNMHTYLSELQADDISTLVVGDGLSAKKQSISGSFLDELLTGGTANDTVKSNGGKDIIYGNMGNDKLYGYINKVDKTPQYNDELNAKNFVFDYAYNNEGILGSGKDTVYNAKIADRISVAMYTSVDKTTQETVQQFLTDVTVLHKNKNLVIDYGYGIDSKGNTVVTDSITVSGYDKLTSEQAVRYLDITDSENNVLATLDLRTDFGTSGRYNWNSASVKNYFEAQTYDVPNDGTSEVRVDHREVFGNDTYNFSGADSALTYVFDGHGNDNYNTGLDQFIYINDTDGEDVFNLTSTGEVKMFFDVTKEGEAVGNLLFVDSDNIAGFGATGSVEIADWFEGKSDNCDVAVNGEEFSVDVYNICEKVSSWLTSNNYDSSKAAFDAYRDGTATFDEDAMAQLIACYTE